jgi:tetratricopeptide (TPR) repeat protein
LKPVSELQVYRLIAWHFEKAGLPLRAAYKYLQAGIDAYRICANQEAMSSFQHGLNLIDTRKKLADKVPHHSGEETECRRLELTLLLALCGPLRTLEGHAGQGVVHICQRASVLAREIGDEVRLFFAQWLHLTHLLAKADYKAAYKITKLLANVAHTSGNMIQLAQVEFAFGMVKLHMGKFRLAREHFAKVYKTPLTENGDPTTTPTINSLRSCSLLFDAWALWFLGFPEQALKQSREGIALAESMGQPTSLAFALALGDCFMHLLYREYSLLERKSSQLRMLATEQGFSIFSAWGKILQGRGQVERGNLVEGLRNIEEGITECHASGQRGEITMLLVTAAEAFAGTEKGMHLLSEAYSILQTSGETYLAAEISRLQGEWLFANKGRHRKQAVNSLSQAEAYFRDAIQIARKQEARSLELRAATSLSRLLKDLNRGDEALTLLNETYAKFSEGFDVRDLRDARELLEELSSAI